MTETTMRPDPSVTDPDLTRFESRLASLFPELDEDDEPTVEIAPVEEPVVAPSPELRAVTHRIASQFVEVVALSAAQVLGGRGAAALDPLHASLSALERLARAAKDGPHLELVEELRAEVHRYEGRAASGRGHAHFRDALRDWLPRYAAHVGGEEGDRLRRLVEFDVHEVPLFRHLERLRGIGPRRLQRLYAAGLYTVEALEAADVDDMALVTGLPRRLALDVCEATRLHREERRQRLVHELPVRMVEFARVVEEVRSAGNDDLLEAALSALREMERILGDLRGHHELG